MPDQVINYPLFAQTLPSGFCPTTWQAILNAFAQNLFAQIPGSNNQLVVSATKPADSTVAWLQLDSSGRPTYLFYFAQGAWLSKHPVATGLTQWWFSDLPNFNTFDGGDSNPLSPISGPMWRQAQTDDGTVIAARFPLAAGTLPSGTVLNAGDLGGEETHSLTVTELAPHTHVLSPATPIPDKWSGDQEGAGKISTGSSALNSGDEAKIQSASPHFEAAITGGTGNPPVVVGHNNMPLYCCGYLLQRTSRQFYSVT